MRNLEINSGDLVPVELRLAVYKEALQAYEDDTVSTKWNSGDGLCLLLPNILWGQPYPYSIDVRIHPYWRTVEMFPELRRLWCKKYCEVKNNIFDEEVYIPTNKGRIKFLKDCIKKLEKACQQK